MNKVLPDFNNSLINITASIKKKFGKDSPFPSIKEIDDRIKDKNHVIVILLDGLGINMLNKLSPDSFLRRHFVKELTSLFPPTTACCTTAFLQGTLPGNNGWFGWHQYFEGIKKDLVMFTSMGYYDDEKVSLLLRDKYVSHHEFGFDLDCAYEPLMPSFMPGGFSSLKSMLNYALKITQREEKSYTYCYWEEPDSLVHMLGTNDIAVKNALINIDKTICEFAFRKKDDTEVIIIADHGLVDVECIRIDKYPDVYSCLEREPSLDARCLAFYVKEGKGRAFEEAFNKHFKDYFELYKTQDFVRLGMFGKVEDKYMSFLGDYIAVAIDKYYISVKEEDELKGAHSGFCKDEMMIPLIMC